MRDCEQVEVLVWACRLGCYECLEERGLCCERPVGRIGVRGRGRGGRERAG